MKNQSALAALFLAFSFSALAEVPLTEANLLGKWSVDAESIHRDGSSSKKLDTEWDFQKDGTMIGTSIDSQRHARVGKFRASLKYRIDGGKLIKQSAPGRSKEETCTAIEIEGPKMVLKCKSVYFFMTKK